MRYEEAGVHIEAKAEALRRAREAIAATYTPEVLRGMGAFGGLYAASRLKALEEPVLVATTDGVGTKTLLALEAGDVSGLGFDLVNHSVNDLLAQGAEPLFFLDYLAASRLDEGVLAALLASLAEACRAHGIPLLGGKPPRCPASTGKAPGISPAPWWAWWSGAASSGPSGCGKGTCSSPFPPPAPTPTATPSFARWWRARTSPPPSPNSAKALKKPSSAPTGPT